MALFLVMAAAPAQAGDSAHVQFGSALAKIAQFSPEERRALRERWEQAGPEERLRLRREFQDRQERLRQMPPDSRRQRSGYNDGGSFGTGFERRHFEDERFAPPAPMPNPGDFFGRRHNRDEDRP
jgi:hypothetical protein